jgi:lysophospholipase L1-like esterase
VLTAPNAVRVLCFGDSNTHGVPGDDPAYVRLEPDVRWTGRLQRLLGGGHDVVEEGLSGRTTDVDYVDRPHFNGRTAFPAALMSHDPLDLVVVMLGSNDLKTCFARGLHLTLDSHEPLARLVADVAQGIRTPPIA